MRREEEERRDEKRGGGERRACSDTRSVSPPGRFGSPSRGSLPRREAEVKVERRGAEWSDESASCEQKVRTGGWCTASRLAYSHRPVHTVLCTPRAASATRAASMRSPSPRACWRPSTGPARAEAARGDV